MLAEVSKYSKQNNTCIVGGLKALGDGRHCSIAFNKSRSHRRRISSKTERLRCGNNCDNISIALSDTVKGVAGTGAYLIRKMERNLTMTKFYFSRL